MTRRTHNAGFTLVELLVVIAILAALVGLLLPAIQSARESSRRVSCINNQKQIAMSMMRYDDTNQCLPGWKNRIVYGSGTNVATWPVMILPTLERVDVFNSWSSATPQSPYLEFFVCPSSPSENTSRPALAYAGNCGSASNTRPADGVLVDNVAGPKKSLDAITDGAPTTFLLFDKNMTRPLVDASGNTIQGLVKGYWDIVPTVSGSFTFQNGSEEYTAGMAGPVPAIGIAAASTGNTEKVINCDNLGVGNATPGLISLPSSNHTGGAVAAFADASVRMISESLTPSVYAQLLSSDSANASAISTTTWQATPVLNQGDY